MKELEEAVNYFKQNEGYTKLFKNIRNKYINSGEIKGNIIITNLTDIERQMLSGLMKKDYSRNKQITRRIIKNIF